MFVYAVLFTSCLIRAMERNCANIEANTIDNEPQLSNSFVKKYIYKKDHYCSYSFIMVNVQDKV